MAHDELDDFESIEGSIDDNNQIDLANIYNIRIGGFGESSDLRTYFSSVKIKHLQEDLDLYETLTKDKSWPISQIVQREVDRIRVSNISKSYILSKGRPVKYFPPIIVAILPKDSGGKISLNMDFGEIENIKLIKELIYSNSNYKSIDKIKPYVLKSENLSNVKGLFVLEVSKIFETYLFSWDKSKYYAIVIDGQHRLEALYKSLKENPSIADYQQDVVFLDFGVLLNEHSDLSPVEVVRRVFVDINTNAQRVGFVRQVLMDDKDLSSLCVQSIVDSVEKDGSEKPQEYFIKSQVVDWYGDKLKHTLPHLAGILSLYQIIDDYLVQESISSINDLRSPRKVAKWVTRMNDIFFVDQIIDKAEIEKFSSIKPLHISLKEYEERRNQNVEYDLEVEDEFKESELFEYDYTVLDIARHTFETVYLKPLVKFFNELFPNAQTFKIIEDEDGFNPEKPLAKALVSSRKKIAHTSAYKQLLAELKVKIESALSEKFFLFFTVLGQKSIFNNLFISIQSEIDPDFNEESCMKIVEDQLSSMNHFFDFINAKEVSLLSKKESVIVEDLDATIVDLGTISSHFWEGIIYDNDSIIYNTQGIRSFTFLISEFVNINNARIAGTHYEFDIKNTPYVKSRTKRIIGRRFEYTEDQVEDYCNKILDAKNSFILKYFAV